MAEDHLAEDFRSQLNQISQDFDRLEGRIKYLVEEKSALERENAELKFGAKSPGSAQNLKKVAMLPVALRETTPPECMEDQFEEAFGKDYLAKPPKQNQLAANVRFQQSKTISRSNSGVLFADY